MLNCIRGGSNEIVENSPVCGMVPDGLSPETEKNAIMILEGYVTQKRKMMKLPNCPLSWREHNHPNLFLSASRIEVSAGLCRAVRLTIHDTCTSVQ